MDQKKRREKTSGLGYYTCIDKNVDGGCIYCGDKATTREHIPSKAFLLEPYPDNLPTIPACFKCNNGFSADEEYVACYLEVLKSQIYSDFSCSTHINKILSKKPKFKLFVDSQISKQGDKVKFSYDEDRLVKIINKLAIGHAGYDFDYVDFDDPINTNYSFIFYLSDEKRVSFESPQVMNCFPEISSRFSSNYCIIENTQTGEVFLLNDWVTVQEGRYKYHIYLNDIGGISVRMIIYDFLETP